VKLSRAAELRDRLLISLELFEDAENILTAKLRRDDPLISEEELEAQVRAWLLARPNGEAAGPHIRIRQLGTR